MSEINQLLPHEKYLLAFTSKKVSNILNSICKNLFENLFLVGIYDKDSEDQNETQNFYISSNESSLKPKDLEKFYSIYEEIKDLESIPKKYIINYQPENLTLTKNDKLKISLLNSIQQFDKDNKLISFCTYPRNRNRNNNNKYYYYIVLQIDKDIYRNYDCLEKKIKNYDLIFPANFINILIYYLLYEIEFKLDDYPSNIYNLGMPNESLLRSAGDSFINVLLNNQINNIYEGQSKNLYNHINDICFQTYEGEGGSGSIIFSKKENKNIIKKIEFLTKIPIEDHKASRKLLEMTDKNYSLLCDSEFFYGLGEISDYDGEEENIFEIKITKRYYWDFLHNGEILMRIKYREPYQFDENLNKDLFVDELKNVFDNVTKNNSDYLWKLIETSQKQKHGTMIVITDKYISELERLKHQSILINPIKFDKNKEIIEFINSITSIDGSVMVDLKGYCHAIGVILDGDAIEKGDISRGARYNAGLKYVEKNPDCLIITVSEDGNVDIIINNKKK